MDRLTYKSNESDMVWFVDHENNDMKLEPCEMSSHHSRLAIDKLSAYEDAEDQGFLLKLPCKVGDTVYAICTCKDVETVLDGTMYGQNGGFGTAAGYYCPYELNDKCPHTETDDCEECKNIENVFEDTIAYINIEEYDIMIGLKNTNLCANIYDIGKTVFLTQEQAEEALNKMRETEE